MIRTFGLQIKEICLWLKTPILSMVLKIRINIVFITRLVIGSITYAQVCTHPDLRAQLDHLGRYI